MSFKKFYPFTMGCVLAVMVSMAPAVLGQVTNTQAPAQAPNPVNLWVVDLQWTGNRLSVGTPVKLTRDEGNNSQPAFTPDGLAIVFSAQRDSGRDARSDTP